VTRADRRTLVRQLDAEGLSRRQIAARLGISKDTVRRDLRQPEQECAAGHTPDAPGDAPEGAPQVAPPPGPGAPVGAPAPAVAHDGARLVVDLSQRLGLADDLAVLARTGRSPAELLGQAVGAVADAYRAALRDGRIEPGVPFFLPPVALRPAPWMRRAA
jgi:DNA-binding transcriptional MocR family regulator